jgi:hypothetical protein
VADVIRTADENVEPATIRLAVEWLAAHASGVSLVDWEPRSQTLLSAADEIESLRALLRAARQYVFDAEVPYEHLYDDQQNLLERIDAAAPPPAPAAPRELCDKESNCILDKGHNGDCDDMPF